MFLESLCNIRKLFCMVFPPLWGWFYIVIIHVFATIQDNSNFTKEKSSSSIKTTTPHKESSLMGVEERPSTLLGFKCLEITTNSGNKTCWSYSSTTITLLSQPTYSMIQYNNLNLGLSWRVHILCATITLKVIAKDRKGSNTSITLGTIIPYKISNFVSNFHTSMEGLMIYDLNTFYSSWYKWKMLQTKHLKVTNTLWNGSKCIIPP